MNTIFVLLPIHNRKQLTLACLERLMVQTYASFQIIVIDDGSTDGSSDAIHERFPSVTILHGSGAWWWVKCMNEGLRFVLVHANDSDYVLTLNDDTEMDKNYIEELVRVSKMRETAHERDHGIVGSVLVNAQDRHTIIDAGVSADWEHYCFPRRRIITPEEYERGYINDIAMLAGRGALIPVNIFRAVGPYHRLLRQSAADYEFILRAARAGCHIRVATRALLFNCDPRGAQQPHRSFLWTYFNKKSNACLQSQLIFALVAAPSMRLKFLSCLRIFYRMGLDFFRRFFPVERAPVH